MEEIEKIVRDIIAEIQPYVEFDEETNLREEGVLDSMSLLVLIQELEGCFSIEIQVDEVTEDNFKNVKKIALFLRDK